MEIVYEAEEQDKEQNKELSPGGFKFENGNKKTELRRESGVRQIVIENRTEIESRNGIAIRIIIKIVIAFSPSLTTFRFSMNHTTSVLTQRDAKALAHFVY
ncbi:hypothetical protein EVAR_79419_1 [Eumeta japonica]|uniref:Uncharacterized protein n=1 Tax=Eumeta variegata TaxID=151549 RepID=A0A4C1VF66_EUMVA|nr:hypothetical protein EVAR_79419_1 [Eumeta japonica]